MFTRSFGISIVTRPTIRSTSTVPGASIQELLQGCQTIRVKEVEWGDQDSFQHVNNTVYMKYLESARINHLMNIDKAANTTPFLSTVGVGPILGEVYIKYKGPLSFPDTMSIGVRITAVKETEFSEEYKIVSHKTGRVVVEAKSTIVSVDYTTGKRANIPSEIVAVLKKDLAGEPWIVDENKKE